MVQVTDGAAAYDIRDFLTRAIPFVYVDEEGPEGVAVCTFDDGACLVSPTVEEVGRALGLLAQPARGAYDLAIVGAGPVGLATAVYAASEGLSTVVVDEWRTSPSAPAPRSSPCTVTTGFAGSLCATPAPAKRRRWTRMPFSSASVASPGPSGRTGRGS